MMSFHQWLARWASWLWPLLLNHLWEATLFSGLAVIAVALLKRAPARARYAVWLLASAKFALPSVLFFFLAGQMGLDISSFFNSASSSTVRSAQNVTRIFQVVQPAASVPEPVMVNIGSTQAHNEIYCLMTIFWLIGSAWLLGRWLKRDAQFSQALKEGDRVEAGREAAALERVKSWLAIKRDVALVISPKIVEPGVWGIWKPVVVLPETMADELSDAELEAVLLHELVHVRRWDNLTSNLHMLLCCLLWFHPLIWLIDRRLIAERERACDDRVIEMTGAAAVYAKGLLKVSRFGVGWKIAGISCVTGSALRRRIEHMMADHHPSRLLPGHRILLGAIVSALIIVSVAAGLLSRNTVIAQNNQTTKRGASATTVGGGMKGRVTQSVQMNGLSKVQGQA